VDHFGNVITSIGRLRWTEDELVLEPAFQQHSEEQARFRADSVRLTVGEKKIERLGRTYADVGHGNVLALVGSEGHLEIAVREGSGADELGLQPRDLVELRW
jgi:S-adenosylmethionine hydrolase